MDATMIVAITGFVVGVGGLLLNLRGQRDQNLQQRAASAALQDKTRLDETQQALDAATKRAELAEAGERVLRAENQNLRAENNRLDDLLDEQRDLHRHTIAQQEARCREQLGALTDVAVSLRGVVTDEIARAAASTALGQVLPHPHDPPAIGSGDQQP